jgi:hypothetical protein
LFIFCFVFWSISGTADLFFLSPAPRSTAMKPSAAALPAPSLSLLAYPAVDNDIFPVNLNVFGRVQHEVRSRAEDPS